MSVQSVKAICMMGMTSDLDKVIRYCGRSGLFHPDEAPSFQMNMEDFRPLSEKNPYAGPLQEMREAVSSVKGKLQFAEGEELDTAPEEVLRYVKGYSERLRTFSAAAVQQQQAITDCQQKINQVRHFIGKDLNFTELMKCRFVVPTFGRLPKESMERLEALSGDSSVLFFPAEEDAHSCWGFYVTPIQKKKETERLFAAMLFEPMDFPMDAGMPEEYLERLTKELETLQREQQRTEKKTAAYLSAEQEKADRYYTRLEELDAFYAIRKYVYVRKNSFVLEGWIPADKAGAFQTALDGMGSVEYELIDGKKKLKHSPPVILKNPPFFRLYEFYVKMYGLPNYNEIDPTPLVALTYTLFFGIMFGDVGQGIVLAIVGALMWKLKKMEIGRILVPCGLMGAVFGFFYGSVFGFEELLTPVHQALFHTEGKLLEVMEADTINMIIYGSVLLGFLTIVVSMVFNMASSFRRRDAESALFGPNGLAGFVFYVAVFAGLVCTMLLNIPVMTPPFIICFVALPLLLMFLREPLGHLVMRRKNWQPENWGEYCMQSFFELFEMCLSYVTNTMSFLRVGAYILVHAGMMLVVFTLAEMIGGVVGYSLAVIIGNGVVMALEALLVAIQVLRLDYYEVFSRFYIGEGRPFTPVTARSRTAPEKK